MIIHRSTHYPEYAKNIDNLLRAFFYEFDFRKFAAEHTITSQPTFLNPSEITGTSASTGHGFFSRLRRSIMELFMFPFRRGQRRRSGRVSQSIHIQNA